MSPRPLSLTCVGKIAPQVRDTVGVIDPHRLSARTAGSRFHGSGTRVIKYPFATSFSCKAPHSGWFCAEVFGHTPLPETTGRESFSVLRRFFGSPIPV